MNGGTASGEMLGKREPAAQGLVKIGAETVVMAKEINDKVWNILTSISRLQPPGTEKLKKDIENYPPLFTELRGDFLSIQESLEKIQEALSLVEL